MPVPIAVLSSDWHLDRGAWRRHRELTGDSAFALKQIVDLCIDRQLPLVAAGDLLDDSEQEDPFALATLFKEADRMQAVGLPLYGCSGNHERCSRADVQWLTLHAWPTYIHQKPFKLGPFDCFGLDQTHKDQLSAYFDQIPEWTDILVTHFSWKDFMGEDRGDARLSDVPYVRMVITGDFHEHRTLQTIGRHGQDLRAVSPGSTHLRSVTEEREKSVYVLWDDFTLESVPLKTRPYQEVVVTDESHVDQLIGELDSYYGGEDLPEQLRRPIIRLVYTPGVAGALRRLEAACVGKAHLFPKPMMVALREGPDEEDRATAQVVVAGGLRGNLHRVVPVETPEYFLADRLLACSDPKKELDAIEVAELGA